MVQDRFCVLRVFSGKNDDVARVCLRRCEGGCLCLCGAAVLGWWHLSGWFSLLVGGGGARVGSFMGLGAVVCVGVGGVGLGCRQG